MSRPILWTPPPARANASTMAGFMRWLEAERGLHFDDYTALWEWSVTEIDAFWGAIWDHFDIIGTRPDVFLAQRQMPGAQWAPDARLNYAAQILRHADARPDDTALIVHSETFGDTTLSWAELRAQVASAAHHLRAMGVTKGDRVVAILPNTEVALVGFLATASLGAIWSLCAPDMGQVAILDRFRQIEPKVLLAQDGYVHAGKDIDRSALVDDTIAGLPTLDHVVMVPVIGPVAAGRRNWADLTGSKADIRPLDVPFDHPLWIVYSSGTTGNPKPIVHGHGGIALEAHKQSLHHDLKPSDIFCWLTSSGWIMWNVQWVGLCQGAAIAVFDGAPNHPDMLALWRFIARHRVTIFGAGAAFYDSCRKAGIRPRELDLGALLSLGSTGSPLSPDAYDWIYQDVKSDIWLAPISGGTDIAGAFVLGNPLLPVRAGEMQCRALGNAVRAYDEAGHEVFDQVGELVCTEPLPSMPLGFWGDDDGSRLHEAYFDTYPGIWRHGDWIEITPGGGSVIYGRSDATINRKGLRLGSAEIYQAVEGLDAVIDSLVVDLEYLGRDSFMPLFVVVPGGLTDAIKGQINAAIRDQVSPRFAPNAIIEVAEIPRTLSGKKLEVPVKKLLLGGDPALVVNRDSMANPDSFDVFVAYAKGRPS
jgi:acetoacetyl-CoA synthetase